MTMRESFGLRSIYRIDNFKVQKTPGKSHKYKVTIEGQSIDVDRIIEVESPEPHIYVRVAVSPKETVMTLWE